MKYLMLFIVCFMCSGCTVYSRGYVPVYHYPTTYQHHHEHHHENYNRYPDRTK